MRLLCTTILLLLMIAPVHADEKTEGPSNEKAQKTYKEAQELLNKRQTFYAFEGFKKANKQDDGHCLACQNMIIKYGMEFGDWKAVEQTAEQLVAQAEGEVAVAMAHFQFAVVWLNEGIARHKDDLFSRSLSVSLDKDEDKWKEFVKKNEMTWPQYNDKGFEGSLAKMFAVTSIPHTFTIDSDGVLQDEHVGDGSIEGKIKKLIARARELQPASGGSD